MYNIRMPSYRFLIVCFVILYGCGEATVVVERWNEVVLAAEPPEGGTVSGAGTFKRGQEITITAEASPGFVFLGWHEDEELVSQAEDYTFTVTQDHVLEARFDASTHIVTLLAQPPEGGSPEGGGTFAHGAQASIRPGTNTLYTFTGWYEDSSLVSDSPDYSFQVTRDITLTANFDHTPVFHTVSLSAEPPDAGTVDGAGEALHGDSVTVSAVAGTGYHFDKWMEDGSLVSMQPEYTFDVTSNRSLVAHFFECPGDTPRQVLLTWQGDTSTTMTISWRTDAHHEELAQLRYTHDPNAPIEDYSVEVTTPFTFAESSAFVHAVQLTGLEPDTEYHVLIGHPRVGDSFKFKTAPRETGPVVFLAGGDSRPPGEADRRIINEMAAAEEPDFVIFAGDFINRALDEDEWDDWFDDWHEQLITTDGRRIPIVPAIGNHEVDGAYGGTKADAPFYYNRFMLPDPESYYSLTYGPDLLLVTLDSDHTTTIQGQNDWLSQTLSQHSDYRWKVVQYHVAAWPSVRDFTGTRPVRIRENWVPILEEHGVDIVVEAHDHAYKLTEPIRGGAVDPDGVIYTGDGGWGAPIREVRDASAHWWLREAKTILHFWKFTLAPDASHILVEPIFYGDPGEVGAPFMIEDRDTPDPNCERGVQSGNTCCAASCGTCGGTGCGSRPGGSEACCSSNIADSGRLCTEVGPPCVM